MLITCSLCLCVFVLWTECLDMFLHCLHIVLHHGPMEVIFQEFVHRDLVTRYILLLQLFEKLLSPTPLKLWDKISVMFCNLVSVLGAVWFCFLVGGCDAYLALRGTWI